MTLKPMFQVKTVSLSWTGGGALIQRIPWFRGSTCICIFNQYSEYVTHKCRYVVVVFDSTNTKDVTHQRRSKGNYWTTMTFTGANPVTLKKGTFLDNRQNKLQYICVLSKELINEEL